MKWLVIALVALLLVPFIPGGSAQTPGDLDGDGHSDQTEFLEGSNYLRSNSTPNTDDDGDGTVNTNDPSASAGAPAGGYCTGAFGIVSLTSVSSSPGSCGGYSAPTGCSLFENAVCMDDDDRIWVWDGYCQPGAEGDYEACKGESSSNYDGSDEQYTGDYVSDGYGWRNATPGNPVFPTPLDLGPQPCYQRSDGSWTFDSTDANLDNDGDGLPAFALCEADWSIDEDGTVDMDANNDGTFPVDSQRFGDPDDNDPNNPIPFNEINPPSVFGINLRLDQIHFTASQAQCKGDPVAFTVIEDLPGSIIGGGFDVFVFNSSTGIPVVQIPDTDFFEDPTQHYFTTEIFPPGSYSAVFYAENFLGIVRLVDAVAFNVPTGTCEDDHDGVAQIIADLGAHDDAIQLLIAMLKDDHAAILENLTSMRENFTQDHLDILIEIGLIEQNINFTGNNTFSIGNGTLDAILQNLTDHRNNTLEVNGMDFAGFGFDGFLWLLLFVIVTTVAVFFWSKSKDEVVQIFMPVMLLFFAAIAIGMGEDWAGWVPFGVIMALLGCYMIIRTGWERFGEQ